MLKITAIGNLTNDVTLKTNETTGKPYAILRIASDRRYKDMTGLNDTDIRLNSEWQLTQATDGDAPLCSGLECLYQNIVLEALTQPGDVFYDAEFGWGLYDFIQSEDTELTRLEITQRVRLKLQKREVILPESIEISIAFEDDAVVLHCSFRFAEEDERRELDVIIGAVSVEVVSE